MMGSTMTRGESFTDLLSAYHGLGIGLGVVGIAVQKLLLTIRRKLAE